MGRTAQKESWSDDADAIAQLGWYYDGGKSSGKHGLPHDRAKANNKLYLRAGELGCALGYHNLANSYERGVGVERDMKKATHYYELAAMGGNVASRYNLGVFEERTGNMSRAVKHWMIAASAGLDESIDQIKKGYVNGHVTKNDFEKALHSHKEAKDEMKSDQREAAAAANY